MKLIMLNIDVIDANIRQSNYITSLAMPWQSSMLAHKVGIDTGIQPEGIVYLHNDFQPSGKIYYGNYHPNQRVGFNYLNADMAKGPAAYVQPDVTAGVSLVLGLVFDDDAYPSVEGVKRSILRGARLSGGQITLRRIALLEDIYTMDDLRNKARGRFLLFDRKDLLEGSSNRLKDMVSLLTSTREENPWLAATTVGYILCEQPQDRDGARKGYQHALAEPLT